MYPTTQATYQLVTIFGGNYVPEQHSEPTQRWLPARKDRAPAVDFDKMLAVLRSALALQRSE